MTVSGPKFPSQQKIESYFKEMISYVTLYESLPWHMGLYRVVWIVLKSHEGKRSCIVV